MSDELIRKLSLVLTIVWNVLFVICSQCACLTSYLISNSVCMMYLIQLYLCGVFILLLNKKFFGISFQLVQEEIALQLMVSSGDMKEKTFKHAWFYFDIMVSKGWGSGMGGGYPYILFWHKWGGYAWCWKLNTCLEDGSCLVSFWTWGWNLQKDKRYFFKAKEGCSFVGQKGSRWEVLMSWCVSGMQY